MNNDGSSIQENHYNMVEEVDDTIAYETHPYEDKGGW